MFIPICSTLYSTFALGVYFDKEAAKNRFLEFIKFVCGQVAWNKFRQRDREANLRFFKEMGVLVCILETPEGEFELDENWGRWNIENLKTIWTSCLQNQKYEFAFEDLLQEKSEIRLRLKELGCFLS